MEKWGNSYKSNLELLSKEVVFFCNTGRRLDMTILLLIVIYLIFVSLGLPDSILGSSFPAIANNLGLPEDMAGYIGFVISICSVISSLFSDKLIRKFSTKAVVSVSILMTALGLTFFSLVRSETSWAFFPIAVLMGLGAGAIDSALNNYVALHYKAIHMNWLHCSWGIGASLSPLILAPFIDYQNQSEGWYKGILVVAMIQFGIALISFASLPLWNKVETKNEIKRESTQSNIDETSKDINPKTSLFKNPVFYLSMVGFFCYCGMEITTGNWCGFYFNRAKGFNTQDAARLDSMFYIGITVGRFICGPLSLKIKEKNMMRIGETILLTGALLACLPLNPVFSIIGFCMVGLGCAPIYPAIIRLTPYRFSKTISQKAMGLQMAIAYMGNVIVSPVYGFFARTFDAFYALPFVVLSLTAIMVVCHEVINYKLKIRDRNLTEEEKKEYSTI